MKAQRTGLANKRNACEVSSIWKVKYNVEIYTKKKNIKRKIKDKYLHLAPKQKEATAPKVLYNRTTLYNFSDIKEITKYSIQIKHTSKTLSNLLEEKKRKIKNKSNQQRQQVSPSKNQPPIQSVCQSKRGSSLISFKRRQQF